MEDREEAIGLWAGHRACQGLVCAAAHGGGGGSACDHHLPGGVVGKGLRPVKHQRIWGTKHMLQWGPRALDLDDRQTPTSPELGLLDSGP